MRNVLMKTSPNRAQMICMQSRFSHEAFAARGAFLCLPRGESLKGSFYDFNESLSRWFTCTSISNVTGIEREGRRERVGSEHKKCPNNIIKVFIFECCDRKFFASCTLLLALERGSQRREKWKRNGRKKGFDEDRGKLLSALPSLS